MASLYADENYPFPIVLCLRALGHDVLTAYEDGRANQGIEDVEVLSRAAALGRAVLTENRRDYHQLHRITSAHSGIITSTRDPDSRGLADRIDVGIRASQSLANTLIRIVRPNPSSKP